MKPVKQRGFTLLEMLLALTLFSLVALAGYQLLQTHLRSQAQLTEHVERMSDITRLFSLLERDLQHALIPANSGIALTNPPFSADTGGDLLALVRRNSLNPDASFKRIRWRLSANTLIRYSGDPLQPTAQFNGVTSVLLRFYSAGRWQARWQAGFALPEAIDITITLRNSGAIQRIFLLDAEGL